ncbi:Piwi-like protein 3 [Heterocephalus glaber]|uniref:Piwi-like protein 3 n=1 Tax=Heterocephalus glaber TaxID=10181 RepID=G5AWY2_HETGA|nr:Piwi-like protein 3 [Heterocephalus glaber]
MRVDSQNHGFLESCSVNKSLVKQDKYRSRTLKLMNFKQIGRNYYDENSKENFCDNRLEAWRGYVTSVLPYEHSLTLCSDICHKLLRLETAYDIIMRRCEKSLQDKYIREEVSKELVGLIVFTRYNNKTYRVDAINWDQSPRDTFKKSDGSEITFVEYYMQQYNQIITDLDQPLLVSQGRWRKGQKNTPHEPVLLIPQLCYPTGLSDELRQKSKDMSKLTKFMQLYPWERKNELEAFINKIRVNRTAQNELQRWSLRFDTNCLPISGRILRDVKIFQRDVSFGIGPQPADWMRESRSTPLLTVKSLSHWVLLHPREHGNNAQSLLRSLRKVTPTMGITVGQANMYEVNEDPSSYISTLRKCVTSHTNMVVCILPDSEKYRYDEIKKFLCIHCPVPSQCVVAETLMSGNTLLTITTKIAQQMNCKMGGALWKVETAALDSWFRNVQQQPDSVVVYRDGVGDGQLQALLDHEIPQLVSHLRKHHGFPSQLAQFLRDDMFIHGVGVLSEEAGDRLLEEVLVHLVHIHCDTHSTPTVPA